MNNKILAIQALVVSVLLHAGLIWWTFDLPLPGTGARIPKTPYFFNVRIVREPAVQESSVKTVPVPQLESLHFEDLQHETVFEKMRHQALAERENRNMDISQKDSDVEHIIYSNRTYLSDLPQEEPSHNLLKQKSRRQTEERLIDTGRLVGDDSVDQPVVFKGGKDEWAELNRMPGVTPDYIGEIFVADDGVGAGEGGSGDGAGYWEDYQPVIQQKTRLASLNDILMWSLRVYRPDDGPYLYYKISLRVNPALSRETLPSIPKEIVFLMDSSWSIEERRMEEFKAGLKHVLERLNANDRFNILAFKEGIVPFARQSIPYNEDALDRALRFVDSLTMGGKTDTYQALYSTLSSGNTMSPSYLILFSDGRPTQGVTDSTRLISEISRLNQGRTAIFSFSGGLRMNRYLLDFIAYRNRGWSQYATRTHRIGEELGKLYDKIRHPVFLDLRFQVSGVDKDDLYPKILPDMFRNTELVYYGRTAEVGKLVLRLLGKVKGQTVEFLIDGDLQDGLAGSDDIARQWALNKIYDLISRLEAGQDKELLRRELEETSEEFGIHVPYLEEL